MTSTEILEKSISYIEAHLKEPLTAEVLAAEAGFSPYHFYRLFTLHTGMPVMEYIRRRRLAYAALELCEGKRILDVAMDWGFESHGGFSKAFRKVYGFSPDEYRRRAAPHRPGPPNPLAKLTPVQTDILPQVRIEERKGFFVAGMVLRTSEELSSIAQIPALWKRIQVREQENKIYALARPREHGEYYISFPVGTGMFRLITGVKVDDPEDMDGSLYVDWVQPGLYGIFSPPPVFGNADQFAEAVKQTWQYIFDEWLPDSGYCLDEERLDYECYDERCHGAGPFSMDICVPLKIKEKENENG